MQSLLIHHMNRAHISLHKVPCAMSSRHPPVHLQYILKKGVLHQENNTHVCVIKKQHCVLCNNIRAILDFRLKQFLKALVQVTFLKTHMLCDGVIKLPMFSVSGRKSEQKYQKQNRQPLWYNIR
uniref:Uncharacterized protein n=1 Tax=Pyxicephalus adspersus TaxID=30357 RepID=A0AAV3A1A4_PYXAD|nr:TPA: hypothetical protein GDO54_003362 [Pyxicephalus adspersus]